MIRRSNKRIIPALVPPQGAVATAKSFGEIDEGRALICSVETFPSIIPGPV
jgi:hypothetical protein